MKEETIIDMSPRILWVVHLVLIFVVQFRVLNQPLTPQPDLVLIGVATVFFVPGVVLFLGSVRFIIQYREKWSPTRVYDSGVYGLMRHPMYVGIYLMIIGCGIFLQSIAAFLVSACFLPVWAVMIWLEEKRMVVSFGQAYLEYRKKVGLFFPKGLGIKKN